MVGLTTIASNEVSVEFINGFYKYMRKQEALKMELYQKGGGHPKDFEAALIYASLAQAFTVGFPWLENVK